MSFDTDITVPSPKDMRSEGPAGRDASATRTLGSDAAGDVRPDFHDMSTPAKAALHTAALLLLPVCLPAMALWTVWTVMGRMAESLWFSSAGLYQDHGLPISIDDYVFKPSDLYSGLNLAVLPESRAPHPNQAAFNHISTMVYLFRPKSMQRPLRELTERPTILVEFFARVVQSRVELFQLGDVPNGLRDMWLKMMALLWGESSVFRLSSGLSPEPPVPE